MTWLQGRTLSEEEIFYHEGRMKMRKKDSEKVASYKHSIWRVRAARYYGQIQDDRELKIRLIQAYKSKKEYK